MKIIFLDIDGVLNDHTTWPNGCGRIQSTPVDRLNMILKAVPTTQIVLISAWRYSFPDVKSIEALLCSHGVDCKGRVHGRTEFDPTEFRDEAKCLLEGRMWKGELPKWTDRDKWGRLGIQWRGGQILNYIHDHDIMEYVVIDDLPLKCPNLVRTDGQCGLRSIDVSLAVKILRGDES